jgi:hypothetical protein
MLPGRRWAHAVAGLVGAALAVSGFTVATSPASDGSSPTEHRRFSLLQMNLCLSGVAGCFDDTHYPRVVDEAIGVIMAREPRAATLNEACSGDVARIARATRYSVRFAPVRVHDRPLPCVHPGGRGVFGNAVITRAAIDHSADRAFTTQTGSEERRWLCVTTVRPVDVCTTHLTTRGARASRDANKGQCAEFTAVLAARRERGPVIAAGDLNRPDGCAPPGVWARTDTGSLQLPGRQHGYASRRDFHRPRARIVPATYTDHGYLLVEARLLPRPGS